MGKPDFEQWQGIPRDAIEFPSRGYVRMMIREQKIARKSKDRLQADREQFDIRARRESKHR